MSSPIDPGHPEPDVMAVERLRTYVSEWFEMIGHLGDITAHSLTPADLFRSVQFQRDVNSAGVPLRRVVAYGAWEVDPDVPREPTPHERMVIEARAGRRLTNEQVRERWSNRLA